VRTPSGMLHEWQEAAQKERTASLRAHMVLVASSAQPPPPPPTVASVASLHSVVAEGAQRSVG